ncbi:hypothetical protein [Occultella aeris]|uniref:hypothetical protein n=1 Tax=Occultella aeris TaxID=2761496 RepID=UPI0012EA40DA|nr:hypothetical protein [Occultella aeris]
MQTDRTPYRTTTARSMCGDSIVGRSGVPISMWVRTEMPERGDRIDEGALTWTPSKEAMNFSDTPLLIAVDAYGDTVFNRLQIKWQLPREVEFLRTRLGTDRQPMLDELERLMAVATERVHRYLWFIGD